MSNITEMDMKNRRAKAELMRTAFEDRIAKTHPRIKVTLWFDPHPDLKTSWTRTASWVDLSVSDLLATAPDEYLVRLARFLADRMILGNENAPLPDPKMLGTSLLCARDTWLERNHAVQDDGLTAKLRKYLADNGVPDADTFIAALGEDRLCTSANMHALILADDDGREMRKQARKMMEKLGY